MRIEHLIKIDRISEFKLIKLVGYNMEDDLPIVSFGKYKGKPITEMIRDSNYIDWCKSQKGLLEKYPSIYNIVCVNTFQSSNTNSPTPEHNKIQNEFLKERVKQDFILKVLNISLNMDELNTILEEIYTDSNYILLFGKQKFYVDFKNQLFENIKEEFESQFNWDIKLVFNIRRSKIKSSGYINNQTYDKIFSRLPQEIREKISVSNPNTKTKTTSIYLNFLKNYLNNIFEKYPYLTYRTCLLSRCYCEIKTIVGDDYPCILRTMKNQIALMGSGYNIYILLIQKFESSSTTTNQLIDIFKQSDIKIIFTNEILSEENSDRTFIETKTPPEKPSSHKRLLEHVKESHHSKPKRI